MGDSSKLHRLQPMTAALVGVLFFFAIIGVFGLRPAIARAGRIRTRSYCCLRRVPNPRCGIMKLDPSILARIQFAFTVSFHIIFPTTLSRN